MDTLKTIYTRRSVRKYSEKMVSDEEIHTILRAGMSAPTAANVRDWAFIVVKDKETINKMADANGRNANPLRNCSFAVLACGDLDRSIKQAKDYWIINVSAAVENMLLAAKALGIGSVWIGTYPQEEKINGQRAVFNLPESIIPHSVIAFGYPENDTEEEKDLYDETRVHFEKW